MKYSNHQKNTLGSRSG